MPIIIDHSLVPGLAEGLASVGGALEKANKQRREDEAYASALERANRQMAQEDERMDMLRAEQDRAEAERKRQREQEDAFSAGMGTLAGLSRPTPETQLPSFLPREFGLHANEMSRQARTRSEMENIGRLASAMGPKYGAMFLDRAQQEQQARIVKERAGIAMSQIQRGMARGELPETAQGLMELLQAENAEPAQVLQALGLFEKMKREAAREAGNLRTYTGAKAWGEGVIQAQVQAGMKPTDPNIVGANKLLESMSMFEDDDGNLDAERFQEAFEDALHGRAPLRAQLEQYRVENERLQGLEIQANTERLRRGPALAAPITYAQARKQAFDELGKDEDGLPVKVSEEEISRRTQEIMAEAAGEAPKKDAGATGVPSPDAIQALQERAKKEKWTRARAAEELRKAGIDPSGKP